MVSEQLTTSAGEATEADGRNIHIFKRQHTASLSESSGVAFNYIPMKALCPLGMGLW